MVQARSQNRFWKGVQDPQKVDLLNLTPNNPHTKTPSLVHFVAKSGPFGRFGGCVVPLHPLAMGLQWFDSLLTKITDFVICCFQLAINFSFKFGIVTRAIWMGFS